MPSRSLFQVLPHGSAWRVTQDGSPVAQHVTQQAAIDQAVRVARQHGHSELRIHGADGKVRDARTYGADPFPPRG